MCTPVCRGWWRIRPMAFTRWWAVGASKGPRTITEVTHQTQRKRFRKGSWHPWQCEAQLTHRAWPLSTDGRVPKTRCVHPLFPPTAQCLTLINYLSFGTFQQASSPFMAGDSRGLGQLQRAKCWQWELHFSLTSDLTPPVHIQLDTGARDCRFLYWYVLVHNWYEWSL